MALLLKLPLLVSEAVCIRICGKPPNPPASSGHVIIPDWREHFLRSLAYPSRILRTTSWLAQFIEFLVIIAYHNPRGPISHFVLKNLVADPSCVERLRITPLSLIGNGINLAGTILRVSCYRSLGRLFVFELRIQKDHRLVTDGPYAYVRHPSYTGLILSVCGAFLGHASSSWILQCGPIQNAFVQALAGLWTLVAIAVVASLLLRVSREDAILRKAFGKRWLEWSRDVPYQLIPGVY
ncbi:hypothetical protein F5878DRAFT_546468 [Lentinula raphanica]|uniref:Protein-S-isoprenylcysteine O-methyltransferase n=1 Tax=Lentinula raphanica TaxID=153919 RepID=A0AA38U7B3_9AGAR|nr:hypothetical protein F5880DRAFT_1506812 [Lentinula raphanica]KAJ3833506.1 hypothetical protein F5878DRAFT_546468 [Lentinula raphanica]